MNWKQVKSIKIKEGDVKSLSINSQVVWSKGEVPPEPPVEDHRFRFYNPGDQVNTLSNSGSPSFETSTDGVNWTLDVVFTSMDIQPKGTLYLRGKNATMENKTFSSTQPIECHGSVMDLCDGGTSTLECKEEYQFANLFKEMNTLLTAPDLPAMTLARKCYSRMFSECIKLKKAPELPARNLAYECYNSMFQGCTSLTTTPKLPATKLDESCYWYMFRDCTSLVNAPKLPATKLVHSCYLGMFSGCTSLTTTPELPATKLADYCYHTMFNGCSKLNYMKIGATSWINQSNWLSNVSPTGTIEIPAELVTWDGTGTQPEGSIPLNSVNGVPTGWTAKKPVVEDHRFRFKNVSGAPNTLKLVKVGDGPTITLEKSADCKVYEPCDIYSGIELAPDEVVYLRGNNPGLGKSYGNYNKFRSTGDIECHGSVMDLCDNATDSTTLTIPFQFRGLFEETRTLLTTPELPATKLTDRCYISMFFSCDKITSIPKLPATKLTDFCYDSMFKYCKSLTTSVKLPATVLAKYCYSSMFMNSSVTHVEINATELVQDCCVRMFGYCRELKYIKINADDWKRQDNWLTNVSPTGTVEIPESLVTWDGIGEQPAGSIPLNSESGVPTGWTVKNI